MRLKFTPPHATEALWTELRCMRRCNFKDVLAFHSECLRIGRMLNFDKSAPCSSHAFSIYKSMICTEDLVLRSLEIMLRDGEILTLGNAMHIVENSAIPNVKNSQTADTFASPSIHLLSSSALASTLTPVSTTPAHIDFNTIVNGRQSCYYCG
jgi:hypothetical protein